MITDFIKQTNINILKRISKIKLRLLLTAYKTKINDLIAKRFDSIKNT